MIVMMLKSFGLELMSYSLMTSSCSSSSAVVGSSHQSVALLGFTILAFARWTFFWTTRPLVAALLLGCSTSVVAPSSSAATRGTTARLQHFGGRAAIGRTIQAGMGQRFWHDHSP